MKPLKKGNHMNILMLNGSPKTEGATNEILNIMEEDLQREHSVNKLCLGTLQINYCQGCKACYVKGLCCQQDDVDRVLNAMDMADSIILIAPSYWADVPGQLKVFFDRCTPFSNTNPNRARILKPGKKGYAIALRTGMNTAECMQIIESLKHYFGHMEIDFAASTYFCGINDKKDIENQKENIRNLCKEWFDV